MSTVLMWMTCIFGLARLNNEDRTDDPGGAVMVFASVGFAFARKGEDTP